MTPNLRLIIETCGPLAAATLAIAAWFACAIRKLNKFPPSPGPGRTADDLHNGGVGQTNDFHPFKHDGEVA